MQEEKKIKIERDGNRDGFRFQDLDEAVHDDEGRE